MTAVHQQESGERRTSLPVAGPIFSWEEYQAERARAAAEWRAHPLHKTNWYAWIKLAAPAMRAIDMRHLEGLANHKDLVA